MKPLITVIVMTYNQKDYIDKALSSILSQKINADFNILIHDDCSDDGTYNLLLQYKNKYPDKIEIIRQKQRRFLIDGFNTMIYKYVVPHLDSKYVAYCDGDDYWCDDLKLQKQLSYMEEHPDYSMCFHNAYQLRSNNDMSSKWFIEKEGDLDIKDFVNDKPGIKVATSSIFLRSDTFKRFANWRIAFPVEDVPMYMTAALEGKIHRLPDIMCVYRQFASGSWSSQNKDNIEKKIRHLTALNDAILIFDEETDFVYHDLVLLQVNSCKFRIALINKDFKTIFSKRYKNLYKHLKFKEKMSLKLQYKAPSLYNLFHRK